MESWKCLRTKDSPQCFHDAAHWRTRPIRRDCRSKPNLEKNCPSMLAIVDQLYSSIQAVSLVRQQVLALHRGTSSPERIASLAEQGWPVQFPFLLPASRVEIAFWRPESSGAGHAAHFGWCLAIEDMVRAANSESSSLNKRCRCPGYTANFGVSVCPDGDCTTYPSLDSVTHRDDRYPFTHSLGHLQGC